jgi:small subunit ribosomal protein S6
MRGPARRRMRRLDKPPSVGERRSTVIIPRRCMASSPPTYDLILMLDVRADAPLRAKIVQDARSAIEAQGELLRHDEWGERALAYPIAHKTSAEYHLLQFHAATPELLGGLQRTLRITDGVLRFRIVKLKPGTPQAPDMRPGRRQEVELGAAPHPVEHDERQAPAGLAAGEPA